MHAKAQCLISQEWRYAPASPAHFILIDGQLKVPIIQSSLAVEHLAVYSIVRSIGFEALKGEGVGVGEFRNLSTKGPVEGVRAA